MKITRKNVITGKIVSREIPVNPEDYFSWKNDLGSIEELMPYLSAEDADYIISGTTAEEWKGIMQYASGI